MTAHAKDFGPSSWDRWSACAASVQLLRRLAPESFTNTYALEGSAIHKIGQLDLDGADRVLPGMVYISDIDEIVPADSMLLLESFSPTMEITQEMIDLAEEYATYCRLLARGADKMLVEQRADFSQWVPEGFGTADCVIIKGNKLIVVDLKCGRGYKVDPHNNGQMMLYALGTLAMWDFVFDFEVIETHIYQPRLDNISSATYTVEELHEFAALAQAAAELALSDNPPYNPGEKQCRWCLAKPHCPAIAEAAVCAAKQDFAGFAPTLATADPEVVTQPIEFKLVEDHMLSSMLPFVDLLTDWASAIRQRAYDLLRSNGNEGVPGYKLVHGRSTRRWRHEEDAANYLAVGMGIDEDDIFTRKLISPSQAEKLLGKQKKEIADLIIKPEGALTLVSEDDKRTPASITTAEDDFAHLER